MEAQLAQAHFHWRARALPQTAARLQRILLNICSGSAHGTAAKKLTSHLRSQAAVGETPALMESCLSWRQPPPSRPAPARAQNPAPDRDHLRQKVWPDIGTTVSTFKRV